MSTDPRASIKTLLDASITDANLTRDDAATELKWICMYGPCDVPLDRLFNEKGLDLIFTIEDSTSAITTLGVSHIGSFPVKAWAVDKYSGDAKIITAALVLWKATKELRSVFLANPWGSLRSLKEDSVEVHDLGSTRVWSKNHEIEYKTYSA
ncbi:MAG: hypothetical protein OEZ40_01605 [Candidatus Bathyarchaeota archaeon]|nr:hypothetical protein [Candidatus Bathyarchaeota archaeon]